MNPTDRDNLNRQNRRIWTGVGVTLAVLITAAVIVSPDPEPEPAPVAVTQTDDTATAAPTPLTTTTKTDTTPEPTEDPEPVEEVADEPEPTEEPTEEPEPTEDPDTEPEFDTDAATAELVDTLTASLGGQSPQDFCDGPTDTSWFCFFDHYEVVSPSRIDMHLEFYGGLDTRALAEEGRSWTANMLWDNLPELDTIVSFDSTGLDLGTTYR